jgi:3-methylfumaryl-CoA hydratase
MASESGSVNLRDWIGRELVVDDHIVAAPMIGLSATLDRDDRLPQDGDDLPPLWHWLYFLPRTPMREVGPDGHARLGGFTPSVGLPRRMWAGSRLTFAHAPRVGDAVRKVTRIADITEKIGKSGRLVFLAFHHEVHSPRGLAIREEQDIVYREMPQPGNDGPRSDEVAPPALFSRTITPDPVLLFRYSALTFNSHRIHYDRPYVTEVERYPGLVVHGPLIATLLLDLLRRERPLAHVHSFTFKALRPLFDIARFSVHGAEDGPMGYRLWASNDQGQVAAQATVATA